MSNHTTPFQLTGAEPVVTISALCVIYIPPSFVVSPKFVSFCFPLIIVFTHPHPLYTSIHRPSPTTTRQTTVFQPPPILLIASFSLYYSHVYPPNDVAHPRFFNTCNGCNLLSLPCLSHLLPSLILPHSIQLGLRATLPNILIIFLPPLKHRYTGPKFLCPTMNVESSCRLLSYNARDISRYVGNSD
jgi:hypothetical protein